MTTQDRNLIVAAIPCYNKARSIVEIVRRTRHHVDFVTVVDDGSTDDTIWLAWAARAQVVQHFVNLGPGATARDCLQSGRNTGADVLVILDGNGQHDPDEIPDVIAPILAGEADMVIGSRFMGRCNDLARYHRFGIGVITFLYNLGASAKVTDATSCFRAYNQRALQALHITEPGFGFNVETLVQARSAGLRIREVAISCVDHEQSYSIDPMFYGLGVVLTVIKHRLIAAFATLTGRTAPILNGKAAV